MESKIYDMLSVQLLSKWRKEIKETDSDTWFFVQEREAFENLNKELNGQAKELLQSYLLAMENKLDYIYHILNVKILNIGIQIGIELGNSFAEYDE